MSSRPGALALAVAVAALGAGCGGSSSGSRRTVTMDRAAAAQVAHAEAVAEGLEGAGVQAHANKAWQSRQNGEERIRRERCKRLHPHSACRVAHVKLRTG